jgi:adenosylcobyric acid synthase
VADIDRGGVFASIIGTFHLLEDDESDILRGFVINRFRGDLRFFRGGPELLERHTGRPCLGVLPYLDLLRIDQEDSLSLDDRTATSGAFRVGVIQLPHISNYTDFNALDAISGVAVEYVVEPTTSFDLLIIPGTKNTIRDLRWLRKRGFEQFIRHNLERGAWVLGICGGYQMLGSKVSDPFNVEEGGQVDGLALLPAETELGREKTTIQSSGQSFLGMRVVGYEIHMGRTEALEEVAEFIRKADGGRDGMVAGHVAGTYFHGVFDNPQFTLEFLSMIATGRDLDWRPQSFDHSRDAEYDRLAAVVRKHLDIHRIYEWIE